MYIVRLGKKMYSASAKFDEISNIKLCTRRINIFKGAQYTISTINSE